MLPKFAIITERIKDDRKIVEVNTRKAEYQGIPWQSLGEYGKRKFENLLVLSEPKSRIKVVYNSNHHGY